jgi:hypothetical protein
MADEDGGRLRVWVGFVLYVLVGAFLLVAGLIMPIWAVFALAAVWVMGLVYLLMTWKDRPNTVLIMPFVMAGIFLLVIWLGDVFLDWTA